MKEHPQEIWQPNVPTLDLTLALRRLGGGYVATSIEVTHAAGTPTPAVRAKVFDVNAKEKPLVQFRTGDHVVGQSKNVQEIQTTDNKSKIQFIREMIELKTGSEVQAELLIGEKSLVSPIFRPE